MGEHRFNANEVTSIMERITKIKIDDMSLKDQMVYALNVAKFAESMYPIVEKYAPDLSVKEEEPDLFAELKKYFGKRDEEDGEN